MFVTTPEGKTLLEPVRFHPWVLREKVLEARRAVVVVLHVAKARVNPILAVWTPVIILT